MSCDYKEEPEIDKIDESFYHEKTRIVFIDWAWKFFAITPAFNINGFSKALEFEWLFLSVYFYPLNFKFITMRYTLAYCPYCHQMTNHLNGICQKCTAK